jgi:hypothetical protein
MRFRPTHRASVTRQDQKEHKLQHFIAEHLPRIPQAPAGSPPRQLQIVARSADSPVIRAVAGLAQQVIDGAFAVRIILAQVDRETFPEGWVHAGHPIAFEHEIRWARRPRLIEAHEQLVLGPQTCWIGDCMRRDPAKCDAYESFIEDCGEAAGCASVSFERLWVASEPLFAYPRAGATFPVRGLPSRHGDAPGASRN